MSPNVTLILVASGLLGTGVYLLLARSVIRALIGVLLMGNGINVLFLVASGPAGRAPIVGSDAAPGSGPFSDPVPQALVLTAIVITLAMTAFVLALAHRAWQLDRSDLLDDDEESARIHRMAELDDIGQSGQQESEAISAQFGDEDSGS